LSKPKKYPEAVVGTFIINRQGMMLLVKGPKWKGWNIPGGHIEYGESIFSAAVREAYEEVGLNVKPIGIIEIAEGIFPKWFSKKKHFLFFDVLCTTSGNEVRMDGREILEYKWAPLRQAYKDLGTNIAKEAVAYIIKSSRNPSRHKFIEVKKS
jgi:8-oxo-dGTP pyrophosphatase MutT (NUDIX family)